MKKLSRQETSFDMEVLLQEVNEDLTRMADQIHKEVTVVYDHTNFMFMIDAPRPVAEDCMSLLHNLYENATFEVVMSDTHNMQKLMTSYVLRESVIPEPYCLGDHTELAPPCKIGDKPKPPTVIVKKEHSSCEEVKKHLLNNKRINKLEMDFDGQIFFKVDSTFFLSSLSFEESLKFKDNKDLSEEENNIAHWSVALPELSKAVTILLSDLNKES